MPRRTARCGRDRAPDDRRRRSTPRSAELARAISRSTSSPHTTAVPDGGEMRRVMERSRVDLLVLDLMLPGEDGLSLCRELRSATRRCRSSCSPRCGEDVDRIVGLEIGAGRLPAPSRSTRASCSARISAILRRAARRGTRARGDAGVFASVAGGSDTITPHPPPMAGKDVALSGAEYRLLRGAARVGVTACSARAQLTELLRGRERAGLRPQHRRARQPPAADPG